MSREHQEHKVSQIALAMTSDFDRRFLGTMIGQYGDAERLHLGIDEGIKSVDANQWELFYEEFMGNFGPEEGE